MELQDIPIEKLRRDPNQPRQVIDHDKVIEMAQSIKTEGIINPIEVDAEFVIITGEMRWRASKIAGLETVVCKVIEINPDERFRRQVIENIHHNTMTDWDTAKALKKLLDTHAARASFHADDKGYRELGNIIGKDHNYIRRYIKILEAPAYVQKAVQENKLAFTSIEEVDKAPEEFRQRLHEQAIGGISRDTIREKVNALKRNPEKAELIFAATKVIELHQISPRFQDTVKENLKPTTEFMRIQREMLAWINEYNPDKIVHKDRFLLLLGMSTIVESLNKWGTQANQLTLKE